MISEGMDLIPKQQTAFEKTAEELTNRLVNEKKPEEDARKDRIERFQIELVKLAIEQLRRNGLRSKAEIECRLNTDSGEIRISKPQEPREMAVLSKTDSDIDENFISEMNSKLETPRSHLQFKILRKDIAVIKLMAYLIII